MLFFSPTLSKGVNPNFEILKEEETENGKELGWGKPKWSNLGIEKDRIGTFRDKISINSSKITQLLFLTYIEHIMLK